MSARARSGTIEAKESARGAAAATPVDPIEPFPERLGDFHLIRRLRSDPSGELFLARQDSLSRDVALKVLQPDHFESRESLEQFRRDVEAVARLSHPGIVPVFGSGEEGSSIWVSLEVVEGFTLAEVLDELRGSGSVTNGGGFAAAIRRIAARGSGRAPEAASRDAFPDSWVLCCVRIARDLALALDHAHRRALFHGDVSPANVVVDLRGRVRLIDFGLAVPTLPYVAPEHARDPRSVIDASSDVYSLGVTLYELLALDHPFSDVDDRRTRARVLAGEPQPLHDLVPGIPWDVETICMAAMERDPTRRYESAEAFARDLDNFLSQRPVAARRPGIALRARRWFGRNSTLAVACLCSFALLFTVPVAGLLLVKSERDRLADANRLLERRIEKLETELARPREPSNGTPDGK